MANCIANCFVIFERLRKKDLEAANFNSVMERVMQITTIDHVQLAMPRAREREARAFCAGILEYLRPGSRQFWQNAEAVGLSVAL